MGHIVSDVNNFVVLVLAHTKHQMHMLKHNMYSIVYRVWCVH